MVATGPIGGHVVEAGLAIASTDALAADVVGARLLGFDPQAVRHLWEADRLGLGESDTDRVTFPAQSCARRSRRSPRPSTASASRSSTPEPGITGSARGGGPRSGSTAGVRGTHCAAPFGPIQRKEFQER